MSDWYPAAGFNKGLIDFIDLASGVEDFVQRGPIHGEVRVATKCGDGKRGKPLNAKSLKERLNQRKKDECK